MDAAELMLLPAIDASDDSSLSGDDEMIPKSQQPKPSPMITVVPKLVLLQANSEDGALGSSNSSAGGNSSNDEASISSAGEYDEEHREEPQERKEVMISSVALVLLTNNNDACSNSSGLDNDPSSGSSTSRNKSPAADIYIDLGDNKQLQESPSSVSIPYSAVSADEQEQGTIAVTTPTNQTVINVDEEDQKITSPMTEETTEVVEIFQKFENVEPQSTSFHVVDNDGEYLGGATRRSQSPQSNQQQEDPQILTIETHSSSYNNSPRGMASGDESSSGQEDQDSHLKRHLENLQRVPFGKSRSEICRNCTSFDEAVARTQRDAVFSDQQMWRNLQFVIREKYTSFAKLEAISRIQEKVQELVGFVDSSVLANSCWSSSSAGKLLLNSRTRGSASPSATKELPDDLGLMLQLFNTDLEASNELTNWLTQSIESACLHLENAAKFYQFECDLGHCFGWMVNSLDAASNKLDHLVETGYCNWQQGGTYHNKNKNIHSPSASDWLAASFQEIENCARLLYFWQEKVDRLFASCSRLSPVNKRSPTQRGIYTPADVTFSTPTPYYSPGNNKLVASTGNNSSSPTAATVPARLLLDYSDDFNQGSKVNVLRMNSARSSELPHYWQVEKMAAYQQSVSDVPNYACELIPTDSELQERYDIVTEIAGLLITTGRKVLKSLHHFVYGFIRANFPPLDEQRASLLMALELGEKLDSLNIIDESLQFVQRTLDSLSDYENDQEVVDILNSYRDALLNERKSLDFNENNQGTKSAIVITNVEILKQLLNKANQLDAYWESFAQNVLMSREFNSNSQPEDVTGNQQKSVASWHKMMDLEAPAKESDAEVSYQRPIILPIYVTTAVQTEEMPITPEPVVNKRSLRQMQEIPAAEPITHERQSSASSVSATSSSAESDMVVQSEVAEERRNFTIKGVLRPNSDNDLMSLREAITRGIVDPTSGMFFDKQNNNEPIPIPLAIQRGFIVVEHQSDPEVLRREQKTEHVVVARPDSKRYAHRSNATLDELLTRRSNGTTVFVSDNDAMPPVVTINRNDSSPSHLVVAPPVSSHSRTASPSSNRPTSLSPHTVPDTIKGPSPAISPAPRGNHAKSPTDNGVFERANDQPTFVAATYLVEADTSNNNGGSNKTRTTAMSMLVKKLEQDLVLRTAPLPAVPATSGGSKQPQAKSETNNKPTMVIKEKLPLNNGRDSPPSSSIPKPPIRSQVGARGSVRKIAKMFEPK